MENENTLHQQIKDFFLVQEQNQEIPQLHAIKYAHKKIRQRKKSLNKSLGLVWAVAGFLNMKIKLYQAILIVIILTAGLLVFAEKEEKKQKENSEISYQSNIAAINNGTVLPSINTFVVRH